VLVGLFALTVFQEPGNLRNFLTKTVNLKLQLGYFKFAEKNFKFFHETYHQKHHVIFSM